ncbi:MAG: family 78 glycoside hydrolase catalytic domain [Planctomycetota bacterium]
MHNAQVPHEKDRHIWRSHWIWPRADDADKNCYVLFRGTFELAQIPRKTLLRITAETRYRLWVNGAYVGEGASPSVPTFKYYDLRELGGLLRVGGNCVAVLARHLGQPDTIGGLLAELCDGDDRLLTATGHAWRCQEADAWRRDAHAFPMNYDPYQEHHDARRMPADWTEVDFDDSRWLTPEIVRGQGGNDRPPAAGPWSRLVPRDIPYMDERLCRPVEALRVDENLALMNRTRSEDVSITLSMAGTTPLRHTRVDGMERLCEPGEGPAIVQGSTAHLKDHTFDGLYEPAVLLDFGRVITANVELDIEGHDGATVDGGIAERLVDGQFNNSVEGQFGFRLTIKNGRQRFRTFSYRGFRYLKLRFSHCDRPIKLHGVYASVFRYPFEERGAFESSDRQLNRVFELCRDTHRLCCVESITDTPWRERAQWLGDVAAVTLGGIYACFGETRLAAKFLRQSAATQLPTGLLSNTTNIPSNRWRSAISDYSLWWIHGLYRHYLYTGEGRWLNEYWPHAAKILDAFAACLDDDGLVADMPFWVFIDWANVEKRGRCAALNALMYGTLEIAGRVAEFKSDRYWVDRIAQMREGMAATFSDVFWDEARGGYVDAESEGVQSSLVSEHANAAAILWGLCDGERARGVVDRLWGSRSVVCTEAQPFFCMVVLRALIASGRFDLALSMVRERWGRRIADRGHASMLEEWTANGSWRSGEFQPIMRTHSHAWSAYAAQFLVEDLIGLEILTPGCLKIRVEPREVDFDYEATFPLRQGPVRVIRLGQVAKIEAPPDVLIERVP